MPGGGRRPQPGRLPASSQIAATRSTANPDRPSAVPGTAPSPCQAELSGPPPKWRNARRNERETTMKRSTSDKNGGNVDSPSEWRPHPRRRFLFGSAGALAAGTAALFATSTPASAATGSPFLLGESNSASSQTFLDATTMPTGTPAFQCNVTGQGSLAVYGATGGGIGVQGSDYGAPLNEAGIGVYGTSDLGDGMQAQGGRNGVWGIGGATGAGVLATNVGDGTALKVEGRAVFSRSGHVKVAAGAKTVTVPGVALTLASLVLASLQNSLRVSSLRPLFQVSLQAHLRSYCRTCPTKPVGQYWLVCRQLGNQRTSDYG